MTAEVILPEIRQQAEMLPRLDPPSEDLSEIEAIVAAVDHAVAKARPHPSEALTEVTAGSAFAHSTHLARAYGFKICALN